MKTNTHLPSWLRNILLDPICGLLFFGIYRPILRTATQGPAVFFVLSKTLGFFLVPSNLIMASGALGLGLIFSKRRRMGGWLLACCVAALLISGFSPIGPLMLLPFETRFSRWDPHTGDPAGIIVLGGGIDPELTAARSTPAMGSPGVRIGPRMHRADGRVVSNFIVQALAGEPITLYGDGNQTRSFCYVSDLIDGLVRLMDSPPSFTGSVNLGNPVEFTMRELAELILKETGSRSKLVNMALPQDDPKQRRPDISLAKAKLGWEPKINLADGLKPTVDFFRQDRC